jgi:transposase-like protein
MRGHGAKFTRKMEEAVAAMLTQRNVEEAARSVGVSIATLMRWQKEPEYQKGLPGGPLGSVRAIDRAAPARNLRRSDHSAENDN